MHYEKKIELLSPVGSWDHLIAAVENGCDAVYLGGTEFNARQSAQNFDIEDIAKAVEYCHIRGVKVFVTINILCKDKEMKSFLEFVRNIYEIGVDAVIVQDLGAASLIRKYFPDFELHASTQMTIHNTDGIHLLEEMGFSRVVLARELALSEISAMVQSTKLDVECFVHGALCIAYSGQCLTSSMIGGRSGNRGRCAQPCRLPYSLVDREKGAIVAEAFKEKHLLSPKDINTLHIIPELIEAGISSLKIEGRLKRPEYTAVVTRIYRKYIDLYLEDPQNYEIDPKDMEQITQIFNRGGVSTGYYEGKQGRDMMTFETPKNWGIPIGKVVQYNPKTKICEIALEKELHIGDGIEIWTKQKPIPSLVVTFMESTKKGVKIKMEGNIYPNDVVYKTSDKLLLEEVQKTFKNAKPIKRIPVYGNIDVRLNQPLELTLWDDDGNVSCKVSDFQPEKSIQNSITREKIQQQVSKMGNTPYYLSHIAIHLDEGISISVSKINELRRNVVEELTEKRKTKITNTRGKVNLPAEILNLPKLEKRKSLLTVYCKNSLYVKGILDIGVDRIYIDYEELKDEEFITSISAHPKRKNTELIAVLPRISRNIEMRRLKKQIDVLEALPIDGYLLGNIGQIQALKLSERKKYGDFGLNVFNKYTANVLQQWGMEGVTLSPELNLKEINHIAEYNTIHKEILVYGYLPLMITEYCMIGSTEGEMSKDHSCKGNCKGKTYYGLLDRKGMTFPVIADGKSCMSEILNSQPLFVLEQIKKIAQTGCDIRIQLSIERKREALEIVAAYKAFMEGHSQDEYQFLISHMQEQGFTKGHFYRGVE